ncbi:MAG: hypothetical protein RLZZ469_1671 [Bacteroidota bacterium]|jgi:hypothetical protein
MKTIDEIRRDNLSSLINQAGSLASFSERIEKNPSQVSQWKNASLDSKTGKKRVMSNYIARELEHKLNLGTGWMDTPHDENNGELEQEAEQLYLLDELTNEENSLKIAGVKINSREKMLFEMFIELSENSKNFVEMFINKIHNYEYPKPSKTNPAPKAKKKEKEKIRLD